MNKINMRRLLKQPSSLRMALGGDLEPLPGVRMPYPSVPTAPPPNQGYPVPTAPMGAVPQPMKFSVDNLSVGGLRARNEFYDDQRRDATANRDITVRADTAKYGADKQFEGQKYGADSDLTGRKYSADSSLRGQMYASDNSLTGQKYGADKQYAGQVYGADSDLAGRKYSADSSLTGQKYGADKQYAGQVYGADSDLAGRKYSSDNSLAGQVYGADKQSATSIYETDAKNNTQQFYSGGRPGGYNSAYQYNTGFEDRLKAYGLRDGGEIGAEDWRRDLTMKLEGPARMTPEQQNRTRAVQAVQAKISSPSRFQYGDIADSNGMGYTPGEAADIRYDRAAGGASGGYRPLGMKDGGMFDSIKRLAGFGPKETVSEKYARQDAEFRAANPQAAASAPAKPQHTISNYVGNGALERRMKAAGLREGGDLRTGHGGAVPGKGAGDKIPAKYEPGEFVVSNDMLDAQPELRGYLRQLHEQVLAKKGMTVEDAREKALGGKTMMADDGYSPARDSQAANVANIEDADGYLPGESVMERAARRLGSLLPAVSGALQKTANPDKPWMTPSEPTPEKASPIVHKAQAGGDPAYNPAKDSQRASVEAAAAPQNTVTGPDGRQYINEMVSPADRNQSDALIKEAFNRPVKTGGEFSMDGAIKRLSNNQGAMDTANKAWAQRGAGIMASRDKNGGLVLSNSTAPEKMQYSDVDGNPTTRYENTQQYKEGVTTAARMSNLADKMEAEREQAEAEGYAGQDKQLAATIANAAEYNYKLERRNLAMTASDTDPRGKPTQRALVARDSIKALDAMEAQRLNAYAKGTEQRVMGARGAVRSEAPPSVPTDGTEDEINRQLNKIKLGLIKTMTDPKATPEQKAQALAQLQGDKQKQDKYTVVPGGQVVIDGQTVTQPSMVFDNSTRQFINPNQGGVPDAATARAQAQAALKANPANKDEINKRLAAAGYQPI